MGTHVLVLNESLPMNTKMTGCRSFQSFLSSCALDEVVSALKGLKESLLMHLTRLQIFRKFVVDSKFISNGTRVP